MLIRRLWDPLQLGAWIDGQAAGVAGRFRSSLMVELWVAPLVYGGSVLDDLAWFRARGIRRLCLYVTTITRSGVLLARFHAPRAGLPGCCPHAAGQLVAR